MCKVELRAQVVTGTLEETFSGARKRRSRARGQGVARRRSLALDGRGGDDFRREKNALMS